MPDRWLEAIVDQWRLLTPRIAVIELIAAPGSALPPFTAGAHIDVLLPGGIIRQYSLCGSPHERKRYRLAVLRESSSRGGSLAMHQFNNGDRISISAPRNRFPLAPVQRHLLFAGGIGITPLLAMTHTLEKEGRDYFLHYYARSREDAAFIDELEGRSHVTLHLDNAENDRLLNLQRALGNPEDGAHIYACGPGPFMDWLLGTAAQMGWPQASLHMERFQSAPEIPEEAGPLSESPSFLVRLASSGVEYTIPADMSVLDVLLKNGVAAAHSCQQGICGECVVQLLSGRPDHRDSVLSAEEHASGLFAPCCSRGTGLLELAL